jgi:chaperonin GroES
LSDVRLVGDNLLIKPDPKKTTTDSGIELVEKISTNTTTMTGSVLARGPGIYSEGTYLLNDVNVGDRVLFPKWAGQEIDIDNEQFLLIKERDILCVLLEEVKS